MLTFNFLTLTAEPIELDFSDFIPAPDYSADGNPVFAFGTAIVSLTQRKDIPYSVCILSDYDEEEGEWQSIRYGTCTAETFEALDEYYYNNI